MDFFKYPKIKVLGDLDNKGILDSEVEVTEKCDGGNFRCMLHNDIIYGSRNRELEPGTEKMFDKIIVYVSNIINTKTKEIKEIQDEYGSVILFGEAMMRHTIGYDFEHMPKYLGFDIYSFKLKKFLKHDIRRELFTKLGLSNVPLISVSIVKDKILVPKSKYYSGYAEGIVIKNHKTQQFAKVVRDEFKEKNKEVFGGNKKFAKDDTEYFIAAYCTNARIEKIIFKLIDDNHKLEMKLMTLLPKLVYTDIWEEEWKEIYPSHLKIDLKNIRKSVANRCKNVLLQMIENNK